MLAQAVLVAATLMLVLSSAPLPISEEGTFPLAAGEERSLPLELMASAHVTILVRSNGPAEVSVIGENGAVGGGRADPTSLYRLTQTLEHGSYRVVISNRGDGEVGIEYQVHRDYVVVANMTAKNVMALSLAVALVIAAAVLRLRPRRT